MSTARAAERRKTRIQVAETCFEEACKQLRAAVANQTGGVLVDGRRQGIQVSHVIPMWTEAYDELERARTP